MEAIEMNQHKKNSLNFIFVQSNGVKKAYESFF